MRVLEVTNMSHKVLGRRMLEPFRAPEPSGSESGHILMVSIIVSVVVSILGFAISERLGSQVRAVSSELRLDERDQLAMFVKSRLDCRRAITDANPAFSPSNKCTPGTELRFHFYSDARPATRGPQGTLISNSTGVRSSELRWFGRLYCDNTSLKLTLKLWDTRSRVNVKDVMTGEVFDGISNKSIVSGDSRPLKICPEWFGGDPDSRVFAMGRTTLQRHATVLNPSGSVSFMSFRCDGSLGEMVDSYFDPVKCPGADTGSRVVGSYCFSLLGANINLACKPPTPPPGGVPWYNGFTSLPAANAALMAGGNPPNTITQECSVPVLSMASGNTSCMKFCQTRSYSIGMLSRCDRTMGSDLDPEVADSVLSQAVCYCMR
jgi:hypothetical protein